ncbi:MAG: hypothetical protein R6V85_17510 [Polyangia bacterium]
MTRRGPEPIPTRVGLSGERGNRFCGKSVERDLVGCSTPLDLVALCSLGRPIDEAEHRSLSDLSVVLTAADPRIWPLKLTRLLACYGRSFCGIAGGVLGLVGNSLGPQSTQDAAEMLWKVSRAREVISDDEGELRRLVEEEIGKRGYVPGFGIPYRSVDVRLSALDREMAELERDRLPFYRLKGLFQQVASTSFPKLIPNVSLGGAALCLDIGFRPDQIAPLVLWLVSHTYFCNAAEEASSKTPVGRSLLETSIDYVGRSPRRSSREVEASTSR